MGSSIVSSLSKSHHFMKNVVLAASVDTTTVSSDRFSLAQGRQPEGQGGHTGGRGGGMLTWRGEEATLGDVLVDAVVPEADKVVLEEGDKMAL